MLFLKAVKQWLLLWMPKKKVVPKLMIRDNGVEREIEAVGVAGFHLIVKWGKHGRETIGPEMAVDQEKFWAVWNSLTDGVLSWK